MWFQLDRAALLVAIVVSGGAGCVLFADNTQSSAGSGSGVCLDLGPAPPHSTPVVDAFGCTTFACTDGFGQCGDADQCATDLLRDTQNCGACGRACTGGTCTEGSCFAVTVLADGLPSPQHVAVDAANVYVVTSDGIQRVPKAGGAPTTFAVTHAAQTTLVGLPLAADPSGVYWVDDQGLSTASASDATPTLLVSQVGPILGPLVLDETYVYWMTVFEDGDAGSSNGNVWRVPKLGGAAEVLSPFAQVEFYFPSSPIAAAQGQLAFADVANIRVVGPTAASTVVAEQSPGVSALAADDGAVYWIPGPDPTTDLFSPCFNLGGGGCPATDTPGVPDGIFAVGWSGGAVRKVSATGGLFGLLAAGSSLWGLDANAALWRVDKTSGLHTLFAAGGMVQGFAVDSSTVYWTRGSKLLSGAM